MPKKFFVVFPNRLVVLYPSVPPYLLQDPSFQKYNRKFARVLNSRHTYHSLPRSDFDFERCSGTASSCSFHPRPPIRARARPWRVIIENLTGCSTRASLSFSKRSRRAPLRRPFKWSRRRQIRLKSSFPESSPRALQFPFNRRTTVVLDPRSSFGLARPRRVKRPPPASPPREDRRYSTST